MKMTDGRDSSIESKTERRKSVIGTRYAGHDSMPGIIDVVMISSLGKPGNIDADRAGQIPFQC